jgi:hypothetical protein
VSTFVRIARPSAVCMRLQNEAQVADTGWGVVPQAYFHDLQRMGDDCCFGGRRAGISDLWRPNHGHKGYRLPLRQRLLLPLTFRMRQAIGLCRRAGIMAAAERVGSPGLDAARTSQSSVWRWTHRNRAESRPAVYELEGGICVEWYAPVVSTTLYSDFYHAAVQVEMDFLSKTISLGNDFS